jgi:HlyD family secretion protein
MARSTTLSPNRRATAISKLFAGVLVLVVVIGALGLTGVVPQVRRAIPGLAQTPPAYQTIRVRRGDITVGVTATGPIAALTTIPLTFKTSGKLADLKVAVGEQVKQGQILAVLDPTDLKTALDQAKSNLDQVQANKIKVEAGPTAAQKDVAQASLASSKDAAATAQQNVATTRTSVADDVTTAQSSVHTAQLSLTAAQHALQVAQDQQARGLVADQGAVTTAQKNLDTVKASVAANVPILLESIEKAKTSLWSAQVSRDNTCSRSQGADCVAANITVSGAQTSLNTAADQVKQSNITAQQQIATAQTQLDQANTQLSGDKDKLAAAIVSAQDQVNQAAAGLANARTGVDQAQHKAAATVASAEAQAQQASDSARSSEASYRQSTAPPDPADVAAAKAQVVNAQAALATAQANLDAAALTAPMAATVATINGSVGQFVSGGPVAVGDTALFTLVDLSKLKVTAQVNEADIGQVQVGNAVTFSVNAFPAKTFTGKVVSVQPLGTVTQNVVNYAVTCAVDPPKDAVLFPGMTAIATIIADQRTGVLRVPNTALTFAQTALRSGLVRGAGRGPATTATGEAGGPSASPQPRVPQSSTGAGTANNGPAGGNQSPTKQGFVLSLNNGSLVPMRVTVGITDGTDTEVVAGLSDGDSVVDGPATGPAAGAGNRGGGPGPGGNPLSGGLRSG